MAELPATYDEIFGLAGHRLRNRMIALIAVAVVAAAAAFGVWDMFFSGGGTTQAQAQTATADRGDITRSISTTGVVSAQQTTSLSFQQSGKVTGVFVTLGQKVKQGDVLAQVDPTDLQTTLDNAKLSLATAQTKLQSVLQGSTASALAAADQGVASAQAAYDKALRAQADLQQPPSAVDVQTAQQAVTTAQAQLQKAQQARSDLDANSAAAIGKAQEAVDAAQRGVDKAQAGADAADATVSADLAALDTAESAYCPESSVSFCSTHAAPISLADQQTLTGVVRSGTPTQSQAANAVLQANSAYAKALSDQQSAHDALDTANTTLSDAEAALTEAQAGPTAADIATADAAIGSAQAALASAQDKLNKLLAGPTQDQIAQAQSDVDTAAAALKAAQAKRDEAYAGPLPADVQQAQQAVQAQQLAVETAQRNLDKTKIIAPFDGAVAALNIQVGDNAGGGASTGTGGTGSSGNSSSAAIVLNTPDAVRIDLTVGETDFLNVKVGQTGTATFDAIPGRPFPIVIDAIGGNPTTTQGVVTYQARAHIVAGAPGRGSAPAPPAATAPQPGMNARITIIVDQRQNVVRVPTGAITRQGGSSTVQVRDPSGAVRTVTVQTGLADTTYTEITGGIDEGTVVVLPVRTAATTGATSTTPAAGAGGGGGGFRIGGGGFGGGGGGRGGAGGGD